MKRVLTALLIAGLVFPAPVFAATPESALQSEIDARVAKAPAGTGIIAATVDSTGVQYYQAGNSGTARPLDKHTLFEIGSVTKTFTATILARMVLAHRVSLDDPVAKYLPASVHVPSRDGKQITLGNLATQHSGLPRLPTNFKPANPANPYADYTVADLYAFLNTYKLTRDPGAKFEYSNVGVGLLGLALANAAHTNYTSLVRSYVWKPLGMTETRIALGPTAQARFAAGHDDLGPVHSWEMTDAIAGAGAIRSDAVDMVKYLRAAMGHGPLGRAMLFAQRPRATMLPGYKIGLIWWTDGIHHVIQHGGDTAGYHAMIAMTADRSRGIVMLSNGPEIEDIALHALVPSIDIVVHHDLKLTDAQLDAYDGEYANLQVGLRGSISRVGHALVADIVGQGKVRLYPSSPDHFYLRVTNAYIQFIRKDGKIVGLVLTQGGQTIGLPKLGPGEKPLALHLQPEYPPVVPLDAATMKQYVGTYVDNGLAFAFLLKEGQLFAKLGAQKAYPVFASAKDHFYLKVVDAYLTFNRDASGKIASVTLEQNAVRSTYVKKP